MLRFRKPPRSLIIFLIAVIAIGAAFGHLVNASRATSTTGKAGASTAGSAWV
jgi:hypothetical protein